NTKDIYMNENKHTLPPVRFEDLFQGSVEPAQEDGNERKAESAATSTTYGVAAWRRRSSPTSRLPARSWKAELRLPNAMRAANSSWTTRWRGCGRQTSRCSSWSRNCRSRWIRPVRADLVRAPCHVAEVP